MSRIVKLLTHFHRKKKLKLIKLKRRLRDLKYQSGLKREQYKLLQNNYNKKCQSKAIPGELSVLPEEFTYLVFDNEFETIAHRITNEIIRHGELDIKFDSLKKKFCAL
jgi:hypothetical protein